MDGHDAGLGPTPVFLISFPNIHHAFKCESVMRKPGRRIQVMPVPRQISSSCGLAVEIRADDIVNSRDVVRQLEGGGVDYEGLFLLRQDGRYELISECMEEKRGQ